MPFGLHLPAFLRRKKESAAEPASPPAAPSAASSTESADLAATAEFGAELTRRATALSTPPILGAAGGLPATVQALPGTTAFIQRLPASTELVHQPPLAQTLTGLNNFTASLSGLRSFPDLESLTGLPNLPAELPALGDILNIFAPLGGLPSQLPGLAGAAPILTPSTNIPAARPTVVSLPAQPAQPPATPAQTLPALRAVPPAPSEPRRAVTPPQPEPLRAVPTQPLRASPAEVPPAPVSRHEGPAPEITPAAPILNQATGPDQVLPDMNIAAPKLVELAENIPSDTTPEPALSAAEEFSRPLPALGEPPIVPGDVDRMTSILPEIGPAMQAVTGAGEPSMPLPSISLPEIERPLPLPRLNSLPGEVEKTTAPRPAGPTSEPPASVPAPTRGQAAAAPSKSTSSISVQRTVGNDLSQFYQSLPSLSGLSTLTENLPMLGNLTGGVSDITENLPMSSSFAEGPSELPQSIPARGELTVGMPVSARPAAAPSRPAAAVSVQRSLGGFGDLLQNLPSLGGLAGGLTESLPSLGGMMGGGGLTSPAMPLASSMGQMPGGAQGAGQEAMGSITSMTSAAPETPAAAAGPNMDRLLDQLWRQILQRLRVERERTRGLA